MPFDRDDYRRLTDARLAHLAGLGLPFAGKRVLDVGAGIGHFSEYFVKQGCDVTCLDGREENVEALRAAYPEVKALRVDVGTDELDAAGVTDVVFCYGLIYHLIDPLAFIHRVARLCREMMLIETCISDSRRPRVTLVPEAKEDASQALHGWGSRPSPGFVALALETAGFDHVYRPRKAPDHEQFRYRRLNTGAHRRRGRLMRDVFVASRRPLDVPSLKPIPGRGAPAARAVWIDPRTTSAPAES